VHSTLTKTFLKRTQLKLVVFKIFDFYSRASEDVTLHHWLHKADDDGLV